MPPTPHFVDIGVNFHSAPLKGLATELLDRARQAGVTRVLATGTSLEASRMALHLALAQGGVWATAGVHPHAAKEFDDSTLASLRVLWDDPKVVAVGECGLDYNRMFSPAREQRRAFAAQLEAATLVGKPLFLHCRDAFDDFHAMLSDTATAGRRGVVHCFTGTASQALAYLELGLDIGITGWVTDPARGGDLRDALAVIPLDRLHLETDAPYLRPKNAIKSRRYNEPALLPCVAQAVAELKRLDVHTVAEQATRNACSLFALP